MALTLDEVKTWLRQDHDADDSVIESLMDAAQDEIEGAGAVYDESNPTCALLVKLFCAAFYDSRGGDVKLPPAYDMILERYRLHSDTREE